jgi:hypothetical protein
MRCLVFHKDGHGQCVICSCGAHVRPHEWREHIGAAVEALSAKRDAEAAVIEAAKAQLKAADALRTHSCILSFCIHDTKHTRACIGVEEAVTALLALERGA